VGYRKLATFAGIAACATVVLSACGSSGGGSSSSSGGTAATSSSPVNVLAIVDTTGPTKAFGSQQLAGIQAAAKYYNDHGGIAGRKVTVTVVSDNGDPATAVTDLIKQMTTNPNKYTMVYPGSEGGEVTALIPVLAKYHVVGIGLDDGSGACVKASACPNVFSNAGSASIPEQEAANWMKQQGYKKAGVLEEEVDFTQSETAPIISNLNRVGIPYQKATFSATAVDVTSEMSQLKSSGADVVFAEALGASAGYVLKARAALNWNVPVLFDIAGSALDLTTLAPPADVKNAYQTLCPCAVSSITTPGLNTFKTLAPAGTLGPFPANLIGDGWDPIILLANAVKQAKSTNYKSLVSAIENLDSAGQNDSLYIETRHHRYSTTNHENLGQSTSDFVIKPAGPIKDGQVQEGS
jgi:branched-chain amino acid transport system substrate-binding protein